MQHAAGMSLVPHDDQDALDEIKNNFPLSLKKTKEIISLVDEIAITAMNSFNNKELINKNFHKVLILDKNTISECVKVD